MRDRVFVGEVNGGNIGRLKRACDLDVVVDVRRVGNDRNGPAASFHADQHRSRLCAALLHDDDQGGVTREPGLRRDDRFSDGEPIGQLQASQLPEEFAVMNRPTIARDDDGTQAIVLLFHRRKGFYGSASSKVSRKPFFADAVGRVTTIR